MDNGSQRPPLPQLKKAWDKHHHVPESRLVQGSNIYSHTHADPNIYPYSNVIFRSTHTQVDSSTITQTFFDSIIDRRRRIFFRYLTLDWSESDTLIEVKTMDDGRENLSKVAGVKNNCTERDFSYKTPWHWNHIHRCSKQINPQDLELGFQLIEIRKYYNIQFVRNLNKAIDWCTLWERIPSKNRDTAEWMRSGEWEWGKWLLRILRIEWERWYASAKA